MISFQFTDPQRSKIPLVLLLLIFFLLPISCFADDIRKVDFREYMDKVKALNSACASKGMHSFSGFCLSQAYGKVDLNNSTQTSIDIGLQIASLNLVYSRCEHSDIPSTNDTLNEAKKTLDANKYFEEIQPQKEALENYVGHFYFCKTKKENDLTILDRLKFVEYMNRKYAPGASGGSVSANAVPVSAISTTYAATLGSDRLSLTCTGNALLDTPCQIRVGSSGDVQPLRFTTQTTQYSHLLRLGLEKALRSEQSSGGPSASDIPLLRALAVDQCHPAAESQGVSGDLLQLCIPSDPAKIVLFMRGLCDRCDFEPIILRRQVSP